MFPHPLRTFLILFLLAGSLFLGSTSLAASGQPAIYRWVDENGTVHYSDAPPPDKPAEQADLPGITVVPAPQFKKTASKKDSNDQEKDKTETSLADLRNIKLVRPKPEENLWGTGGTVTAEVDFPGRLPRGYAIQFVLDGKPLKPVRKKVYVIKEVIRGEHTLYAQVIEVKTGTVVAKTEPVTFYLKQATVQMHNNG